MKTLMALCGATLLASSAAAAGASARILKTGTYTATVAALPCSACPPKLIATMKGVGGITKVSVDKSASRVTFTVSEGAKVRLALLQERLQDASDEMGMGADYTLRNVKTAQPQESKYKMTVGSEPHSYRFDAAGNPVKEEPARPSRAARPAPAAEAVYACPMGDYNGPLTKDGRCPKCGMTLQKQ